MRSWKAVAAVSAAMALSAGCAVRKPVFPAYRLVAKDSGTVLVPPGVANAEVSQRVFVSGVAAGPRRCQEAGGAVAIQVRRKRVRVSVDREELAKQPAGWLGGWPERMAAAGCIGPGDGWKLANEVAESVPMDSREPYRLLHAEDIGPGFQIQVDSPVFRDGRGAEVPEATAAEGANGLNVVLKSSDNLLGYERTWYQVRLKAGGSGLGIFPGPAERHVGDTVERQPQPAKNYFAFSSEANHYRLVYKQQQTAFTALIAAGRTREDLDARAKKLAAGDAACEAVEAGFCVALPKGVSANVMIAVTVNGEPKTLGWGATVRSAIPMPAARVEAVLSTLQVWRQHNGKAAVVEFDRGQSAILNVRLMGGESIRW